ncbi:hypothetical protein HanRHA438_Chr09g0403891 [Helianthus annuus]|nr:hypothetical protein HanRHA438_Chr09g0403891 [Helianthus annuus]
MSRNFHHCPILQLKPSLHHHHQLHLLPPDPCQHHRPQALGSPQPPHHPPTLPASPSSLPRPMCLCRRKDPEPPQPSAAGSYTWLSQQRPWHPG